jgi:hypothetical protein
MSALSTSSAQTPASATRVDITRLVVGPAATVAELDLGALKGELRQIGWSADGTELYVQTVEGSGPSERLRHYTVPATGGAPAPVGVQPEWAQAYWAHKSDRFAPGVGSLMIEIDQKIERIKIGTGSAGAADRASNGLGGDNINVASNVEKAAESQTQNVRRFTLLDEPISEAYNEWPKPGLTFSWGPAASGAIAFTDRDGRLYLFDQARHKRSVPGAKNARLPAWSTDGARLAWVQKTGRRTYALMMATLTAG